MEHEENEVVTEETASVTVAEKPKPQTKNEENSNKKPLGIKVVRKQQEMTVKALADAAGVSSQTILNYEAGRCNPPDEVFSKIKQALKLPGGYDQYFSHKQIHKYGPGSTCCRPGCNRTPVSRGFCMTHYISFWRKQKRQTEHSAAAQEKSVKPVSTNSSTKTTKDVTKEKPSNKSVKGKVKEVVKDKNSKKVNNKPVKNAKTGTKKKLVVKKTN